MAKPHQIHQLQFDFSIADKADEATSSGLQHWVQVALLPVIDEVLEQVTAELGLANKFAYRVGKLELDLGAVFADESATEVGRRLRSQLTTLLLEQLRSNSPASPIADASLQMENLTQYHAILQGFLQTGRLNWEHSAHPSVAHRQVLRHALTESRQSAVALVDEQLEFLRGVVRDERQCTRLLRQYETSELLLVARHFLNTWPAQQAELALDWISLELSRLESDTNAARCEDFWRYVLNTLEASVQGQDQQAIKLVTPWLLDCASRQALPMHDVAPHTEANALAAYHSFIEKNTRISNQAKAALQQVLANLRQPLLQTRAMNHAMDKVSLTESELQAYLQTANVTALAPHWPILMTQQAQAVRHSYTKMNALQKAQLIAVLPLQQQIELTQILRPSCASLTQEIAQAAEQLVQVISLEIKTITANQLREQWCHALLADDADEQNATVTSASLLHKIIAPHLAATDAIWQSLQVALIYQHPQLIHTRAALAAINAINATIQDPSDRAEHQYRFDVESIVPELNDIEREQKPTRTADITRLLQQAKQTPASLQANLRQLIQNKNTFADFVNQLSEAHRHQLMIALISNAASEATSEEASSPTQQLLQKIEKEAYQSRNIRSYIGSALQQLIEDQSIDFDILRAKYPASSEGGLEGEESKNSRAGATRHLLEATTVNSAIFSRPTTLETTQVRTSEAKQSSATTQANEVNELINRHSREGGNPASFAGQSAPIKSQLNSLPFKGRARVGMGVSWTWTALNSPAKHMPISPVKTKAATQVRARITPLLPQAGEGWDEGASDWQGADSNPSSEVKWERPTQSSHARPPSPPTSLPLAGEGSVHVEILGGKTRVESDALKGEASSGIPQSLNTAKVQGLLNGDVSHKSVEQTENTQTPTQQDFRLRGNDVSSFAANGIDEQLKTSHQNQVTSRAGATRQMSATASANLAGFTRPTTPETTQATTQTIQTKEPTSRHFREGGNPASFDEQSAPAEKLLNSLPFKGRARVGMGVSWTWTVLKPAAKHMPIPPLKANITTQVRTRIIPLLPQAGEGWDEGASDWQGADSNSFSEVKGSKQKQFSHARPPSPPTPLPLAGEGSEHVEILSGKTRVKSDALKGEASSGIGQSLNTAKDQEPFNGDVSHKSVEQTENTQTPTQQDFRLRGNDVSSFAANGIDEQLKTNHQNQVTSRAGATRQMSATASANLAGFTRPTTPETTQVESATTQTIQTKEPTSRHFREGGNPEPFAGQSAPIKSQLNSLPFKGRARVGMGVSWKWTAVKSESKPIPIPAFPLKGKELKAAAQGLIAATENDQINGEVLEKPVEQLRNTQTPTPQDFRLRGNDSLTSAANGIDEQLKTIHQNQTTSRAGASRQVSATANANLAGFTRPPTTEVTTTITPLLPLAGEGSEHVEILGGKTRVKSDALKGEASSGIPQSLNTAKDQGPFNGEISEKAVEQTENTKSPTPQDFRLREHDSSTFAVNGIDEQLSSTHQNQTTSRAGATRQVSESTNANPAGFTRPTTPEATQATTQTIQTKEPTSRQSREGGNPASLIEQSAPIKSQLNSLPFKERARVGMGVSWTWTAVKSAAKSMPISPVKTKAVTQVRARITPLLPQAGEDWDEGASDSQGADSDTSLEVKASKQKQFSHARPPSPPTPLPLAGEGSVHVEILGGKTRVESDALKSATANANPAGFIRPTTLETTQAITSGIENRSASTQESQTNEPISRHSREGGNPESSAGQSAPIKSQLNSLPFKGRARVGMGVSWTWTAVKSAPKPIPIPAFPLKGKELKAAAQGSIAAIENDRINGEVLEQPVEQSRNIQTPTPQDFRLHGNDVSSFAANGNDEQLKTVHQNQTTSRAGATRQGSESTNANPAGFTCPTKPETTQVRPAETKHNSAATQENQTNELINRHAREGGNPESFTERAAEAKHDQLDPSKQSAPNTAPLEPTQQARHDQLKARLPQRLARALLQADLRELDEVWDKLLNEYTDLFAQSLRIYLKRPELRQALIAAHAPERMLELLQVLSPSVSQLLCECWESWSVFSGFVSEKNKNDFQHRGLTLVWDALFDADLATQTKLTQVRQICALLLLQRSSQNDAKQTSFAASRPPHYLRQIARLYHRLSASTAPLWHSALAQILMMDSRLAEINALDRSDFDEAEVSLISHEEIKQSLLLELSHQESAELQIAATWFEQEWQSESGEPSSASTRTRTNSLAATLHQDDAERSATAASAQASQAQAHDHLEQLILLTQTTRTPSTAEKIHLRSLFASSLSNAITDQSSHTRLQQELHAMLEHDAVIDRLCLCLSDVTLERIFVLLHADLLAPATQIATMMKSVFAIELCEQAAFFHAQAWRLIYRAANNLSQEQIALPSMVAAASPRGRHFQAALMSEIAAHYALGSVSDCCEQMRQAHLAEAAEKGQTQAQTQTQTQAQTTRPTKKASKPMSEPEQGEVEAYVLNAGMVIVAPYVQRLFGLFELTRDGAFVNEDAAQRAVHLLQYIVTGESATPEYQLSLNKLLCGIHGGVPIVAGIDITEHEKEVIAQMLQGVIAHWSALGNTSIDGLRQTFFARQGQLRHEEDAWHLQIPQSTFDMLLDRLPWSFAMIKFPWMPQPLHVNWRN